MKKLIVLFVSIFCGALFAAAEGDQDTVLPGQTISTPVKLHPITFESLLPEVIRDFIFPYLSAEDQSAFRSVNRWARAIPPRAFKFNMFTISQNDPDEISKASGFFSSLKFREDIEILEIKRIKAPILTADLISLRDKDAGFGALTDLNLNHNLGVISVLEKINHLAPRLMSLNVSSCCLLPTDVDCISRMMSGLISLDLSFNKIGGAEVIAVATHMPHLRALRIRSAKLGEIEATAIAQMSHLKVLDLSFNRIGDEGAKAIAKMPHLEILDISNNSMQCGGVVHSSIGDEGAKALAQMSCLTNLNIYWNVIGDAGAAAIAEMPQLRTLDISFNRIGDAGKIALSCRRGLTLKLEGQYIPPSE